MSLKIEYAHRMNEGRCARCIPVVRLDELQRWLVGHQIILSQAGPDLRGEIVSFYVNLTIQAMLAELKAVKP